MQKRITKNSLSLVLCAMLIMAMAVFTTACNNNRNEVPSAGESAQDGDVLGEGKTQFTLAVVDKEGSEKQFEIHTDKETVGEALLELGMIAGDEGDYGLYVKTVNGITVDYDKDGKYWAFYIDDEYANTGVDSTPIEEGRVYSFKVE